VIDYMHNYYSLMNKVTLKNGDKVKVEQTRWKYLHVEATPGGECVCYLMPHVYPDEPWPFSSQKNPRIVKPDFVLFRNFPTDSHGDNFKNQVLGFKMCNIPAVNTVNSVYMGMERVYVYSELKRIQEKIGKENFDVVDCYYYSNQKIVLNVPSPLEPEQATPFPLVCKVGTGHEGKGKIRIRENQELKDFRGVLTLNNNYFTTEPYIKFDFEFRVQKIGNSVRAFKRFSRDSWKQEGDMYYEDMEMTDKYRLWVEECSQLFGGLDMFSLDILSCPDGREIIIELNDCGTGIIYDYQDEDLQHVKDLVIEKMNQHFCPDL